MNNPKVSVIITCYNYGRYVRSAIASALVQTYGNLEVICVNDGSTDNTNEILKEFVDRITILSRPKCSGSPSQPRNDGARIASGDLLLFLDADDFIRPSYLATTVPLMTDKTGVVATWMEMFEGSEERVGSPDSSYPIFSPTPDQIVKGNSLPVTSLIQRRAFAGVGGYALDAPLGSEDWALWAAIVYANYDNRWDIKVVPEYLFGYRVHSYSMSRRMPPFAQTQKWIQERFSGS